MSEDPFADRMKRLEERLEKVNEQRKEPVRRPSEYQKSSLAWRMVIELVVGMVLGIGIGYGLDELLGTRPAFLIVFALLGFAAGIRTMLRTAAEVREQRGEGALTGGPMPGDRNTDTDPTDPR